MIVLNVLDKCLKCPYFVKTPIRGEDVPVCLAMGEMVFIKDLDKCPLEEEVRKEEVKKEEISNEMIVSIASTVRKAYKTISKLNEILTGLTYSFDKNDLIALICGKTRLPKKTVKAVLEAIEKAQTVGNKYALRKFVSVMGNIPLKDVAIVLDEIERLNEKYVKKEEIRKILLEPEGE